MKMKGRARQGKNRKTQLQNQAASVSRSYINAMKSHQFHEVASMSLKLHQKEKSLISSVEQMRLMGVFSSACLVFVNLQLFAIVVKFSLQLFFHLGVAWIVNEVVMLQWVGL